MIAPQIFLNMVFIFMQIYKKFYKTLKSSMKNAGLS
jgi:hypothetical protein